MKMRTNMKEDNIIEKKLEAYRIFIKSEKKLFDGGVCLEDIEEYFRQALTEVREETRERVENEKFLELHTVSEWGWSLEKYLNVKSAILSSKPNNQKEV